MKYDEAVAFALMLDEEVHRAATNPDCYWGRISIKIICPSLIWSVSTPLATKFPSLL
jgi:hypothetical protein